MEILVLTRRQLLEAAGGGFGLIGLASLLHCEGMLETVAAGSGGDDLAGKLAQNPMAAAPGQLPAKAKRVIWFFVNGGPSHVDTWDYKPALSRWDGKSITGFDPSFKNTTGFFKDAVGGLMKSPFRFSPRGECGKMVSEIFPALGQHVDKMAFIHSGFTESNNHSPALFMMNTGLPRMGYPCVGSWVTYGLGSESQDLPGFVVMSDPRGRGLPKGHAANWARRSCPESTRARICTPRAADRQPRTSRVDERCPAASPARLLAKLERSAPREACRRERPFGADRELRAGVPDANSCAGGDRDRSRASTYQDSVRP